MARLAIPLSEAALALNVAPEDLTAHDGRILARDEPSRGMRFAEAAALLRTDRISAVASRSDDYGGFRRRMGDAAIAQKDLGGVQFAEASVDTETGIVRVERVVAMQDCGRPINPLLVESQVQGGVLMGLSYALFEERILDQHTGHMVNPNLEQYKWRAARDAGDRGRADGELSGRSATDAYGVAEPSNIATAAAIANAVYNAIGVRLRALPMTPAAVLTALGRIPREELTMNRFAWRAPIGRRGGDGGDDGGRRMAPRRGAARRGLVVKAGGVDLLDLMKENLLAPAGGQPEGRSGARRHRRRGGRRPANWRDGHSGRPRRPPRAARALPRPRRCGARLGQSADPQRRDARRQPAAAPAVLVFPGGANIIG